MLRALVLLLNMIQLSPPSLLPINGIKQPICLKNDIQALRNMMRSDSGIESESFSGGKGVHITPGPGNYQWEDRGISDRW